MRHAHITAALFAAVIVNMPTVAAAAEWKDPLNNGNKLVHEQFAEPTAVRLSDTVTALVIPQGDDTNVVVLSNGEHLSACRDWSAAHPGESNIGTWGLVDFLIGNDPIVLAQLNQMVANQAF